MSIPPEEIPPFQEATAKYQDPAKQALIQTLERSNELQWDRWRMTVEYAPQRHFAGILDFFANVPSLQGKLEDELITAEWHWKKLEALRLSQQFVYRPEVAALLRGKAGIGDRLTAGWLLQAEDGRIDGETTSSDNSYLLATPGHFAYLRLYIETIH
jgi:hypothetical protein